MTNVFPRELLGEDDVAVHNWKVLLRNVDLFIRARRFETLTLENVSQGMKVRVDAALSFYPCDNNSIDQGHPMAQSSKLREPTQNVSE